MEMNGQLHSVANFLSGKESQETGWDPVGSGRDDQEKKPRLGPPTREQSLSRLSYRGFDSRSILLTVLVED
jgi:hypothetical protein